MTSTSSSPRRRNPVLVTVDIVASVLLLLLILGIALVVVSAAAAFSAVTTECGTGSYSGIQCNSTVLGIVVFALYAIAIVGGFLAVGMVIVNLIRKRKTFVWPLATLVGMVAAFYIASWLVGMIAPTL